MASCSNVFICVAALLSLWYVRVEAAEPADLQMAAASAAASQKAKPSGGTTKKALPAPPPGTVNVPKTTPMPEPNAAGRLADVIQPEGPAVPFGVRLHVADAIQGPATGLIRVSQAAQPEWSLATNAAAPSAGPVLSETLPAREALTGFSGVNAAIFNDPTTLPAVPEPDAGVLLAIGLGLTVAVCRKRRR
jgi:hypothetical protein